MQNTISRSQVILMAVAAGATVANIYYNQPILKDIAISMNVSEHKAGVISMLSQIGYGLGLFFITPLGDKINKKNLILILQILLIVSLGLMTITTNIAQIWFFSVLIGVLSVSVQVIIPMAASMDSINRGKTVGTIISGVLIGILAARVFSGFVSEQFGWRIVYGISAILILLFTIKLKYNLPDARNEFEGHYFDLMKSALVQIKRFFLLRRTSAVGGLMFGVFCSFWTTLTFHLSGPPFFLHSDVIGLFGLVAIAGASLAPYFGKKADAGNANRSILFTILLVIASILLMKYLSHSIIALITGVLFLDIGIQAIQVTNLALIYTLDASSYSRINTIYMTSYFTGGAVGTFAGLFCWKHGGWDWVTIQMLLWAIIALGITLAGRKK